MNKLREQIAQAILTSLQNGEGFAGAADAIIALLQPRMLTKDDLISVYEEYISALEAENNETTGMAFIHGWQSSRVEEGNSLRARIKDIKAKLKLIQEEDSE